MRTARIHIAKEYYIEAQHKTNTKHTYTKKLPMILDSAKVLALSWEVSGSECQRRTSVCGTICRPWGAGRLVQWSRGWNLHSRQKCWLFLKTCVGRRSKSPFLFVREYKIKVWRPYFKKMENIRHVFTLNKTKREGIDAIIGNFHARLLCYYICLYKTHLCVLSGLW